MAFGIGLGNSQITRVWAPVLALAGALACATVASADAFVDKANAAAAATPGTKPAHDILMPALAKLTEPPVSTGWTRDDLLDLLLAAPGDANWKKLEEWAGAEPQQAALKALETITTGTDHYIIGFGYGRDAVPAEWAEADLYIGLNADGLLYSATYPYLKRVSWLIGLTAFESARAASSGDGEKALNLCIQTVQFGRILIERGSLREMLAGASIMMIGLERLRDVMYQFESAFNAEKLREAAKVLQGLRMREAPLPVVNKLAVEQIIARTYKEKGGVEGAVLAEVMSGARSQDRPLLRFSEAAFWADRADKQADWFDATDKIKGVWADWEKRWKLRDLYDPLFDIPSDFKRMDPQQFLAIFYPLNGVDQLFDVRKVLLTELAGTINSMGVVGFRIKQKTTPPLLASVEPKFVEKLETDPFAVDRRQLQRTYLPFVFWVPIRDQKFDRREEPHPYKITVAMIDGAGLFDSTNQNAGVETIEVVTPGFLRGFITSGTEGIIDSQNLTVDANALRGRMIDQLDNHKWRSEELNALTSQLKIFGMSGINAENYEERYDAWFADHGAKLRASTQAIGLDVNEITTLTKDTFRALLSNETITNAMANAKSGGEIGSDEAKNITKAYIEIMIQPAVLDKLMGMTKAFRDTIREKIDAAGGEGLPNTVFSTMVDDKQFLLYSVGQNGIDDRARIVGPGGIDILMWPPILSLQRIRAQELTK